MQTTITKHIEQMERQGWYCSTSAKPSGFSLVAFNITNNSYKLDYRTNKDWKK